MRNLYSIRVIKRTDLVTLISFLERGDDMTAIDKVINIALNEVGYLEKKDNNQLDSKTANAGQNNYTKYWRDIKPDYQSQPWCACFVTWCFEKAFGKDNAKTLLKHYPYVYCPTMANLFTLYATPKKGDIVIFKHGGTFTHTGLVVSVSGNTFSTVEGNTSGGSTIIANGGGVCKKTYNIYNLPGTKFCRPNYEIVEEGLTMTQYDELKNMINALNDNITALSDNIDRTADRVTRLENPMIYNYIDNNMPEWARPTIQKLVDRGILKGDGDGLNLDENLMRLLVINDRAGLY